MNTAPSTFSNKNPLMMAEEKNIMVEQQELMAEREDAEQRLFELRLAADS